MKSLKITLAVLVGALAAGCYNDFDTPAPRKIYTDTDMTALGLEHVTIKAVKDYFGNTSGTGENDEWSDTQTVKFGELTPEETDFVGLRSWPAAANYYIKGKVISSDRQGNIYKSLHLVDETAAIEVKLGTGLYIDFPMGHFNRETGTIDTHYVYVKISGLYVGNYRMMLSIGKGPTDSYNKVGEHKFYANSNMENPAEIKERVFLGEATQLKLGEEILEVTASNYNEFFGQANRDKLGRMVLIRDITCRYGDVDGNLYPSWMCTDLRPVESKYWYKWGANENFFSSTSQRNIHCNFYGSVLFTYGAALPTQMMTAGVFTVRTSGYSRFARQPIVRDGETGDILAIMGIYAKYWGQSYGAYQCSVNRFEDIMFDKEAFLTEAEVKAQSEGGMTPDDSFVTALSNSDYEE